MFLCRICLIQTLSAVHLLN